MKTIEKTVTAPSKETPKLTSYNEFVRRFYPESDKDTSAIAKQPNTNSGSRAAFFTR